MQNSFPGQNSRQTFSYQLSYSYSQVGPSCTIYYRKTPFWVPSQEGSSPCESESESLVAQSCPTLCYPMDCSLPGSSVHGIFQATVLERVAISFSRGASQPRGRTQVSHIVGRHFTIWATREGHASLYYAWHWEVLEFCNYEPGLGDYELGLFCQKD